VDGIMKPADSFRAERPQTWRKRGDEDSLRVVGLFGGSKSNATWADIDIAVCTIEKVRFATVEALLELTLSRRTLW